MAVRSKDAFCGQLSFAYWLPDPSGDACVSPARHRRSASGFHAIRWSERPTLPLHGVDFSGAQETAGQNDKIWIASWYPARDSVELRSGSDDPGIDRVGLASKIIEDRGTWVIDFPFGPPASVAAAAGWTTWHEYIAWCNSNSDPTVLRDNLRVVLEDAGVPWSTKRDIDHETATTWFPFFEQLYRQTITGGRDVLCLLDGTSRERTRILPFHHFGRSNREVSVAIEGFPGWTLRQCDLPSTGYKGSGGDPEDQRRLIVNSLRERGVPISDADAQRTVHDTEGDAVDALVLLHAARDASHRTAAEWSNEVGPHASIEGWFFD